MSAWESDRDLQCEERFWLKMRPATKGGSVSQSRQRLKEKKLKQTMEGRAGEVQRVNRELRMDGTAGRDGEQTTEVTRLLRELVTEVARVHRRDSATTAY